MAYTLPTLPSTLYAPAFDPYLGVQSLNTSSPAAWKTQLGSLVNSMLRALMSCAFSSGAIAIATTTTKIKTTATIAFQLNGLFYSKAATDNFWTLDTTCNCTNGNWQGIWLLIDSTGAASIAAGTQASTQAGIVMPTPDVTKCVVGYVTVNPTGTGNFVGGTTPLGDATVVPNAAYYNVCYPGDFALLS